MGKHINMSQRFLVDLSVWRSHSLLKLYRLLSSKENFQCFKLTQQKMEWRKDCLPYPKLAWQKVDKNH